VLLLPTVGGWRVTGGKAKNKQGQQDRGAESST